MNNKTDKLILNTILFAINSFGSRLIVFLLIPIYSHYLTKASYGIADLVFSTCTLFLSIFTLKVSAAILRFANDKNQDNNIIYTNSFVVVIISGIFLTVATYIAVRFFRINRLYYYLPFIYLLSAIKDITAQYSKAIGKSKVYAGEGAIVSSCVLVCSIVLLVFLKTDADGYLLSYLISYLVAILYLIVFVHPKIDFGNIKKNRFLMKQMLSYSLPLVPNSLSWWVVQLSDRYMVTFFVGEAANGLYSMSYKIPSMLGVLSDIFVQAWVLSAFEEYDGEKNFKLFQPIYANYEALLFIISSLVILVNRPISNILFGTEFADAAVYAPLLIFALMFNNLQAFFGSFYNAAKRTQELLYSSITSALLNIILNIILIRIYGVYGAIISTCLSYLLLAIIRIIGSKKYVAFPIDYLRLIINSVMLLSQAILATINISSIYRLSANLGFLVLFVIVNLKRIISFAKYFMSILKRFFVRIRRYGK